MCTMPQQIGLICDIKKEIKRENKTLKRKGNEMCRKIRDFQQIVKDITIFFLGLFCNKEIKKEKKKWNRKIDKKSCCYR